MPVPSPMMTSEFGIYHHTDAFMVTANVEGYTLHNILINTVGSADILFIKPFTDMRMDQRTLEPTKNPVCSFGEKKIDAVGRKNIPISFNDG